MKLTVKGQVTIPHNLRRKHGLHPGMDVEVLELGDQVVVRKLSAQSPVDRVFGLLQGKSRWKKTDDLIRRLREER